MRGALRNASAPTTLRAIPPEVARHEELIGTKGYHLESPAHHHGGTVRPGEMGRLRHTIRLETPAPHAGIEA